MTNNRINEIDLLRFLAAISVVFYHYAFRGYAADGMSPMPYPLLAPIAKYGSLGVELFFMISGFVILKTAARGSLQIFAVSRIVRLYPAFWACCTITFATIMMIGAPRYTASLNQYLINMTMLSKFVGVPEIDGVYWSLFVEMRFYALVAMVLIIRKIDQAQLLLMFWLISSVALEISPISKLRYLLIVDYSAYFIAGAMCFLIWSKGISVSRVCVLIVSWILGIYQAVKDLPQIEKHYNTTMNSYVVAGIITSFFVIMFLVSIRRTGFVGRNRWIVVGALTYPLYLLHHSIGFMLFNIAYPAINKHVLLWGTIILMLGAAYTVNIFIERRLALPLKNSINHSFDSMHRLATRACARIKIRR